MEDNTVDFEEIKRRNKREKLKRDVKEKFDNAVWWCKENMNVLMFVTPLIVGATSFVARSVHRNRTIRKEESLKQLYVYDKRKGHYCRLKRKLKGKEWVIIDKRHSMGESMSEILDDMKLLK